MVDTKINKVKMDTVENYLKGLVEWRKSMSKPNGWKYSCVEDFVLTNGRPMELGPWKKEFGKRGRMKMCYKNAYSLADRQGLIYCEGIAFSIIPTIHAWCLCDEGKVIDPTWRDGKDYFGVEIPLRIVQDIMLQKKSYGVIDAWEIGSPLLSGKIELLKSGR